MNIMDLMFCLTASLVTALLVYLGWYPQAVFSCLVLLIVLFALVIQNLHKPLPRVIVGATVSPQEPLRETAEKEPGSTGPWATP